MTLSIEEREDIDNAIAILESKYRRYDLRADCPASVKKLCRLELGKYNYENFGILKLDSDGRLMEFKSMFRGTIDRATVYPREILAEVISDETASVILVHNHPSGNVKPSIEDIKLTERLVLLLYDVGVSVIDHIIVSKVDAFSFSETGILPNPMKLVERKWMRNK